MGTRLVNLVADAADPAASARWWAGALGWRVTLEQPDEVVVEPPEPDGLGIPLVFVPVPDPKTGPNRVHLDLASPSAADQTAVVQRLTALGATPADVGQGDVPWVVLADPDGNELCVLEPRDRYRGTGRLAAVVVAAADPPALARFWTEAAAWPVTEVNDRFAALRHPSGTGPFLELIRSPAPKLVKNRLHLDLAPYPDDDPAAEVGRLRSLGATPADIGQGEVTWTVLADPEGNELCVLSPR
jgi:catechol 2,3-dioxygenase-like lactoylglutathione lyase family enzyme